MTEETNPATTQPNSITSRLIVWLRTGGWITVLMFLLPLLLFLVGAWFRRWTSDDGIINFRTVQMILDGHGPVFNPGERVEASTSTLWLYMLVVCGALGLKLGSASVYLGIALNALGLVLAGLAAMRVRGISLIHAEEGRGWVFPVGILTYAAIPVGWDFASSGLEMGLSAAWLGGVFFGLSCWVDALRNTHDINARRWWLGTMFLASLGPVTRPELSIVSFAVAGVLMLGWFKTWPRKRRLKSLLASVVLLGAIPVGYQIFRMGYYAAITPNTAIVKTAFGARWQQGWYFFENFFFHYHMLVPLGLGALYLAHDTWRHLKQQDTDTAGNTSRALTLAVLLVPWMCGLFYVLYVVRMGGGFMHGRMFLPAIFCMSTSVAVIELRRPSARTLWRFGLALVMIVWVIVCAGFCRKHPKGFHGIHNERTWYVEQAEMPYPMNSEDHVKHMFWESVEHIRKRAIKRCGGDAKTLDTLACKAAPELLVTRPREYGYVPGFKGFVPAKPETVPVGTVAITVQGGLGIRSALLGPGIRVVDKYGLSDPLASRVRISRRGRPGHEKRLKMLWFAARYTKERPREAKSLRDARAALACPPMKTLFDAVTAPMTWSRFTENVLLSIQLQRLTFDPNPAKAKKELCSSP